MITVEPRWVGATACVNCGLVCDVNAVDRGGPFFAADETPLGRACPTCPLVPESNYTPGPWEWLDGILKPETRDGRWILSAELCRSEQTEDNRMLIARAPAMRNALEAVLLFHATIVWDEEKRARRRELTGTDEATTRVLCDAIRRALR